MKFLIATISLIALQSVLPAREAYGLEVQPWIDSLHAIGPEGEGNEAAMESWGHLSTLPIPAIPTLIEGLRDGSLIGNNWIRLAIQTVMDSQSSAFDDQTALNLIRMVTDQSLSATSRHEAYQVIERFKPEVADSLVSLFSNDPSLPLRRLSVGRILDQATQFKQDNQTQSAIETYQRALRSARDIDQLETIVRELNQLGQDISIAQAFGFILDWNIIGPFENSNRDGYDAVFPPEKSILPDLAVPGKNGQVSWEPYVTRDSYGKVDINEAIAAIKDATAYAYRDFISPTEQTAELRLGCKNAWKIWFNGEYVFGRDEYHRGAQIDQYIFPVTLRKGSNRILIKICQNEQTESWTREWEFQFRICDRLGQPILEPHP
ncbi:MAG: hypothetical protein LR011_10965 [Verrucomicrobia bacterium]|nr:hypothetical protein [Verrucomicrobiota bacterium]